MSDIGDYDQDEHRRSRRGVYDDDDEEGSDTFGRRPAFDDDDDDDEEDEEDDEQEMEALRDGFVVDDDVEDVVSDDEERRRRRKKKKKRRHAERDRSHENDDDDLLDEEDLALVAENTNQGSYSAGATGSKFKRLKRGRSRKTIDDEDDLDAELNDLVDNGGSDDGHSRYRGRSGEYSDEERGYDYGDMKRTSGGRRDGYDDDLGLFGNDDDNDLGGDDFRSDRRNDRRREDRQRLTRDGYDMDDGIDDDLAADNRGRGSRLDDDADLGVPRASGGERTGAMASYFGDSLDGIDDDTWAELQDIFGDGEEYAFAMDSTNGERNRYREKGLDEVFEPAELEAKMMTQRDEDIRSTDVPERMQMRATGSDSLRTLTEEEIEEETTWVVRQLHVIFQRQESLRPRQQEAAAWGDSAGGFGAGSQAGQRTLFKHADFANERFLAAVLSVLKLLSQEFYEVPYIVRHRREIFVTPIAPGDDMGASGFGGEQSEELPTREWLSHDDIWKLYDFDQQFRGFLSCRHQLTNLLRRLRGETNRSDDIADDALAPVESLISKDDEVYVQTLTSTATRVEDITDITEWLHSQYSGVIRSWKNHGSLKRSRVLGMWEQAKQSGIDKFLARFGITARQVGTNIFSPGSHYIDNNDSAATPLTVAQEFVGSSFATAELVARVGKAMFAQTLAADPQIRRFVRSYCDEHTCMITRPTERGRREITHDDHPAFEFKFLKQKPLAEFMNSAQFIEIEKAEKDGLVRLQFSLTGEYRFDNHDMTSDDRVFDEDKERTAQVIALQIEKHVKSDAMHEAADEWNRLRSEAVTAAVTEHLLPMIWRETTQRLQQQAFDVIADASRKSLEGRIDMQPTKNTRMLPGEKPRVVVVGGGGFDPSSRGSLRIVYINEHGKYVEHFTADSMRPLSGSMAAEGDGIKPLLELLSHQPVDVVAVAGMSLQTKRLFEDVKRVVDDYCSRTNDDIVVTYGNDEVARLWWDCEKAREEFSELRKEERYCISVARTLQDPAIEYAGLGRSLLHLSLHAAQRDVDQDALFTVVERAFVNIVNKVGIDINELAVYPHKQAILQYVSGLGPRKAQAIISKIGPGEKILEARSDLVTKRLCTRTVFVNCASFLRIRPAPMDILDDTRIHPEDYDLARKMALDALDIEDDEDDDNSGRYGRKRADGPSRYVAEVMNKSPEKLEELDLVKYAEELKRLLDVHKLETLKFIKRELQHPNDDPRKDFEEPSNTKVLQMLTGELVGDTIKEDGTCLVAGTIVRVQPRFAIARLDSGLEGFISIANVSDHMIDKVSDELAPGQAIVAVVKRIDLEKMSLDLSIRPSDIDSVKEQGTQLVPAASKIDTFFDTDAETVLRERAKAEQQKSNARTRTIPHPLFRPFNGRQAEQYLANRSRGECVIRPSSRGIDHIAISWKVGEGLFQHVDVEERGKANDAALGTTLLIGDLAYSDLDELLALHIEPVAHKIEEVKRSNKFYDPETDPLYAAEPLEQVLGENDFSSDYKSRRQTLWETRVARHLETLAQSTGRGSYCIALSLSKPGSLSLAFKPTPTYSGFEKWTARVEPNEFRLGDRGRYPNVMGLINGFKAMQSKATAHRSSGSGRTSSSRPSNGDSSRGGDRSSYRSSHGSSSRWGGGNDRERSSRRSYNDSSRGWGAAPSKSSSSGGGSGGWDM